MGTHSSKTHLPNTPPDWQVSNYDFFHPPDDKTFMLATKLEYTGTRPRYAETWHSIKLDVYLKENSSMLYMSFDNQIAIVDPIDFTVIQSVINLKNDYNITFGIDSFHFFEDLIFIHCPPKILIYKRSKENIFEPIFIQIFEEYHHCRLQFQLSCKGELFELRSAALRTSLLRPLVEDDSKYKTLVFDHSTNLSTDTLRFEIDLNGEHVYYFGPENDGITVLILESKEIFKINNSNSTTKRFVLEIPGDECRGDEIQFDEKGVSHCHTRGNDIFVLSGSSIYKIKKDPTSKARYPSCNDHPNNYIVSLICKFHERPDSFGTMFVFEDRIYITLRHFHHKIGIIYPNYDEKIILFCCHFKFFNSQETEDLSLQLPLEIAYVIGRCYLYF